MKSYLRIICCAAVAGLLLYLEGCAGSYGGGKRQSNADLTLISFGSVNGELAACG
jgi:hypothetical protein